MHNVCTCLAIYPDSRVTFSQCSIFVCCLIVYCIYYLVCVQYIQTISSVYYANTEKCAISIIYKTCPTFSLPLYLSRFLSNILFITLPFSLLLSLSLYLVFCPILYHSLSLSPSLPLSMLFSVYLYFLAEFPIQKLTSHVFIQCDSIHVSFNIV